MTTRRDFLKTMTMASAGLAFGAGDVLGARASTTQRKVTDKVKIAYIGIGNRGEQIINDFARTGMVEVVALCDVDMGAAHTQKVMNQLLPIIHISLSVCWLWHQVNMCMWRNLWHVLSMKENC